jgi:hypothetical protein
MQSKGKKGGTVSKLVHELDRISTAVELKSSTSVRDVMDRVCTLDGVEEGSNFYRMATRTFQNREKRDMFVAMRKPHLQLMVLKNEATLLGGHHLSI